MPTLLMVILITSAAAVPYSSIFEWTVHRYFMHRPVGKFDYAFRAHALVHHQTFKADHTYHLINDKDKHTIPMAWWNGPVLILVATLPWIAVGLVFGHWLSIPIAAAVLISLYYGAYERLHWCMHLPKARQLELLWPFRKLNGHHLLHHRYMHKNFNVVLPFADLCFGTLMLRSKIQFAQAMGPSIPDVQPRIRRAKLA